MQCSAHNTGEPSGFAQLHQSAKSAVAVGGSGADEEAGRWLRALWSRGQGLSAEELLAEALGEELDFAGLAAELSATREGATS